MSFLGQPALLLILAFGALIIFYTVRWQLPQRVVATTALWRAVLVRARGAGRLGALDSFVSLLLHLVIASALIGAIVQPRFSCQRSAGRRVVIVLDRSPSMGAIERVEPRLNAATRQLRRRLGELAADDEVALVTGTRPRDVLPPSRDTGPVRRAIAGATLDANAGALSDQVALACRLLDGAEKRSLVVVSDGSEPFAPCEGAELELYKLGAPRPNVGVIALSAALSPHDPAHAEVFVEVENASPQRAKVELRVDLDGALVQVVPLEIAPGATEHRVLGGVPLAGAGHLVAHLPKIDLGDAKDALAEDDVAYALVPHRATLPVDLVGGGPLVKLALESNPRFRVTERIAQAPPNPGALQVLAGPLAAPLPAGRYLLLDPSGAGSPVRVVDRLHEPRLTYWRDDHPVLRQVVLSDVALGEAHRVELPASANALAAAGDAALVWILDDRERRMVGLSFDHESSDLPLRVGFPVLLYNALEWLAGAAETPIGARPPPFFASTAPLLWTGPDGKVQTLAPVEGRVELPSGAAGFYGLSTIEGRELGRYALSSGARKESEISPLVADALPAQAQSGRVRDQDVWSWLALLGVALLLLEWTTFHRRYTL